jgi:pSer/pThr/pTyr-binding forkhead associated (FHA) protein
VPADFFEISRYILPAFAFFILFFCSISLLRHKPKGPYKPAHLTNTANGDIIPLENWENSVGRSASCDIVLNYSTVSRFHAVVALRKGGWLVADTLSRTGVFVNGEPIKRKASLENGDIITFGGASLAFEFDKPRERAKKAATKDGQSGDIYFNRKQK